MDRRTDEWSSESPHVLAHTLTHVAPEPDPGWAPSPHSAACHHFYQTTDSDRRIQTQTHDAAPSSPLWLFSFRPDIHAATS